MFKSTQQITSLVSSHIEEVANDGVKGCIISEDSK